MKLKQKCNSKILKLTIQAKKTEFMIINNFKVKEDLGEIVQMNSLRKYSINTKENEDKIEQLSVSKERISIIKRMSQTRPLRSRSSINMKNTLKLKSSGITNICKMQNDETDVKREIIRKTSFESVIDKQWISSKSEELVNILKNNYILNSLSSLQFSIKKQNFYKLIQEFIIKIYKHLGSFQQYYYPFLFQFFHELDSLESQNSFKLKQSNLRLTNEQIYENYGSKDFKKSIGQNQSKLQQILQKSNFQKLKIAQLQQSYKALSKQYDKIHENIKEQMKILGEIRRNISQDNQILKQVNAELQKTSQTLQKMKNESQIFRNYINVQDNNKLVKMASEDYREIQSQIYQYASYLQCNQLASDLNYQPINVQCITNQIEEKLRTINKTIIQNQDLDLKEKEKLLRNFLLQSMERYKKRDEEQKTLNTFKTKCVITFIKRMKKWLNNWTLKQEYLVNLRNQFVYNSIMMAKLIADGPSMSVCQKCRCSIKSFQRQLAILYEHIEENYKMGNTFY